MMMSAKFNYIFQDKVLMQMALLDLLLQYANISLDCALFLVEKISRAFPSGNVTQMTMRRTKKMPIQYSF